ncbi:MAG: hypothetical protein ABI821_04080 [Pseudomonadota bacterium]
MNVAGKYEIEVTSSAPVFVRPALLEERFEPFVFQYAPSVAGGEVIEQAGRFPDACKPRLLSVLPGAPESVVNA